MLNRMRTVAAYIAAVVAGVIVAATPLGQWAIPWEIYIDHAPDSVSDQVVALAALDGVPIDTPLDEILAMNGIDRGPSIPAPRPPGAVLASVPISRLSFDAAFLLMAVVNFFAVLATCWIGSRIADIPPMWGGIAACLVYLSPSFTTIMSYGNVSPVVTVLILVAWWQRTARPATAGLALGVAASIKLWPFLLWFAMPRRVRWWTLAGGAAMTAGGLALPGVTVRSAVATLGSSNIWLTSEFNVSIAAFLARAGVESAPLIGAVIGVAAWFGGLSLARTEDERIGVTLVAALLISPYSWRVYWLAAVPVVMMVCREVWRLARANPRISTRLRTESL